MLAAVLGSLVGLVLGLTGAGGSILAVPMLMAGMGWTLPQAAPVALVAVCAATTFGTIAAWDVTYVRYRAALLMAAAGFFTAPLGLVLAGILPVALLTLLFAAVQVVVGVRLLRQARQRPAEAGIVRATVAGDSAATSGALITVNEQGRIVWDARGGSTVAGIGAVTGFLAGLLGVGGGFVIVPALRAASGLSMHSIVATSLMAIAMTSAGALTAAWLTHPGLPWGAALPFALGAVAGIYGGRRIAPRIAGPVLQQAFAAVMLVVAVVLAIHAVKAI